MGKTFRTVAAGFILLLAYFYTDRVIHRATDCMVWERAYKAGGR